MATLTARWRELRFPLLIVPAVCYGVLLAVTSTAPAWSVWYAVLLALYALAALAAWRWPERITRALRTIAPATAVIVAALAWRGVWWPYNPNATASLLLLLIPWTLPLSWQTGVVLSGLIVTRSAGAGLALAAGFGLLIAWSYWREGKSQGALPIVLALAIIAGCAIAMLQPGTTRARVDHWTEALRLFSERPLFGWGLGSYVTQSNIPEQNHADNLMLTFSAETGVIGVLLLVEIIARAILQTFTTQNNPARLAVFAWLLHNAIDCTLWFPLVGVALALNLALLWRQGDVYRTDPGG